MRNLIAIECRNLIITIGILLLQVTWFHKQSILLLKITLACSRNPISIDQPP